MIHPLLLTALVSGAALQGYPTQDPLACAAEADQIYLNVPYQSDANCSVGPCISVPAGHVCEGEPACEGCLNLYLPSTLPANKPTILYVHGGSFGCAKMGEPFLSHLLLSYGYPVVSIDFAQTIPGIEAAFPRALQDLMAAIRWIRINSRQYCLSNEVVVIGNSSGAHRAALLGTAWDECYFEPSTAPFDPSATTYPCTEKTIYRPDLVIGMSGVYDLHDMGNLGLPLGPSDCTTCQPVFPTGIPPGMPDCLPVEAWAGANWNCPGWGGVACVAGTGLPHVACCNVSSLPPGWPICSGVSTDPGDLLAAASPAYWADSGDPPFVGFATECDVLGPFEHLDKYVQKLNAQGVLAHAENVDGVPGTIFGCADVTENVCQHALSMFSPSPGVHAEAAALVHCVIGTILP